MRCCKLSLQIGVPLRPDRMLDQKIAKYQVTLNTRVSLRKNMNMVESFSGIAILAEIASIRDAVFAHDLITKLLHHGIAWIN